MVCVNVFESDAKSQTLRTLSALTILILGELIYLFITRRIEKFLKNKMAFLTVWIIIGTVLGVGVLRDNNGNYNYEHSRRDHSYYGILIGLLVYVPLNSWLSSVKFVSGRESIFHTAFGIFITSLAALFTFMIAESSEIIQP